MVCNGKVSFYYAEASVDFKKTNIAKIVNRSSLIVHRLVSWVGHMRCRDCWSRLKMMDYRLFTISS